MPVDPFLPETRFASVPPLPPHYEPRNEVEAQHCETLLQATGTVAITASTSGAAGIGKTTLAKALANNVKVRQHFTDGVIWLVFGRERNGEELLWALASIVDAKVKNASSAGLGQAISQAMLDRRLLIVLDDVWTSEQIDAFASLTSGSNGLLVLLVTTRNAQLAKAHATTSLHLEQLGDAASLRAMKRFMGGGFKASALRLNDRDTAELLSACQGNLAMLRSVAGLCRKRGVKGAVQHLNECRDRQLQRTAAMPNDAHEYGTLYAALEGTLANLSPVLARRAAMLAVFPEDTDVPLAVVAQLWSNDGHELRLDEEVSALAACLVVEDVDWKHRSLTLIDLHHDYLRCRGKSELAAWHASLLRSCGRSTVGVPAGDASDAYWGDGRRWMYHLVEGGDTAIDAVKPVLVDLSLKAIAIGPTEGDAIARLGGSVPSLTRIDVGFNNLDQQLALNIVKAARPHGRLASLGLGSCKLHAFAAHELAEYVRSSTSLTSLDLEYNYINVEGVTALARAIPASALACLNLSEVNRNHDEPQDMSGIVAIAKALQTSRTLTSLNLSANDIRPNGVEVLAEALSQNATLKHLDVSSNRLCGVWLERVRQLGSYDAAAFRALANAVSRNKKLVDLNLRSNELGYEGAEAVAQMLAANVGLTRCDLCSNNLGDAGKQLIKDVIQGRRGLEVVL